MRLSIMLAIIAALAVPLGCGDSGGDDTLPPDALPGAGGNGLVRCGFATCSDGDVCCDHCTGSCVPAESGAMCPDDGDPNRECIPQTCGDDACDSATEVCLVTGPTGPSDDYQCVTVPVSCETDRSCDCLFDSLCGSGYVSCSDGSLANQIYCDNGTQ